MDRREFLKAAAAAGCLAPLSGISSLAGATQAPGQPILLTVFLRGGADGLLLVGPSADPDYVAARPPELRVADSGERAGFRLERSLVADADFRLHQDAAPLAAYYQAGHLAVVHATGLGDGTRSHFVAQDLIERGIADEKRLAGVASGWLARAIAQQGGSVPAYSATNSPVFALHGLPSTLAAPDLAAGLGIPWGAPTAKLLQTLATTGNSPADRASRAALSIMGDIDRQIPRDPAGKVVPYKSAGKMSYEGAGELARGLSSIARLARMDAGLVAACIDHGGWDTHEGQGGRFANQVRQLSIGLAAFHDDMAAAGRPVVSVVMTEFGRRLRANKSGGTDHGHGSCWLVLGDGVAGGRMYGQWPGLATPQLDRGVDLAITTDYRTILSEALAGCGLAAKDSFPDWHAAVPLGLFARA